VRCFGLFVAVQGDMACTALCRLRRVWIGLNMRPRDALGRDVYVCLTSRIADEDNMKTQMDLVHLVLVFRTDGMGNDHPLTV
jgi:hypothetical protein